MKDWADWASTAEAGREFQRPRERKNRKRNTKGLYFMRILKARVLGKEFVIKVNGRFLTTGTEQKVSPQV